MPLVHITLLEGRTEEQKRAALTEVTHALERTLGARPEQIRVWFTELKNTDFAIGGKTAKEMGR